MSLVSIIIPTYNRYHMVSEAIESALAQTYEHCEVIVIDDDSTDGTSENLRAQFGSRIILHRETHGGVSRARNIGIRLACGDYIKFLDSDDCLPPDAVELQIRDTLTLNSHEIALGLATELGEPALTYTNHNLVRPGYRGLLPESLVLRDSIAACLPLFPRALLMDIGGFNPDFQYSEDYEMCVRIVSRGYSFFQFPTDCYKVRAHKGVRLSTIVDKKKYGQFYQVMLGAGRLVDSGRVPGRMDVNKSAISLRAWSLGREAARHGLRAESEALFTLCRDLDLSQVEVRSRPVITLSRLIGPFRTERALLFIRKMVAGLLRRQEPH